MALTPKVVFDSPGPALAMTRHKSGFTLIELLIVVVVIGILAAVAVPKFATLKGRTRAATIRADLRNLVTAQEEYLFTNGVYTSNVALLPFTTTEGVIVNIVEATGGGWSATTTHPLSLPLTCAIFYGTAAPLAPAVTEGVINCQ
jgi:prepilin-type N-terminal cleavage/methylation domain-containing protein